MGLLPVLVVSMAIVQAGIGLLVALVNYTEVGKKVYGRFFDNEIALFDDSGKSSWDDCCCLVIVRFGDCWCAYLAIDAKGWEG